MPLPRANPVSAAHMAAFRSQSNTLIAALEQSNTKLAAVKKRRLQPLPNTPRPQTAE